MGMELANNMADSLGGLCEWLVSVDALVVHRKDDPALDWNKPVTHVGDRAVADNLSRVIQRPLEHRCREINNFALPGENLRLYAFTVFELFIRHCPPSRPKLFG